MLNKVKEVGMMHKKRIFFVLIMLLLIFLFIVVKIECPDMSKHIDIKVSEIMINDISESDPPYDVVFRYYNWSDELKNQVDKDIDSYVMVNVGYTIKNKSSKTELSGIEFYPIINKNTHDFIMEFNHNNGNHYINCTPNEVSGMRQTLIVKRNGKTNEQIRNMIMELCVEMIYYTGGLKSNTGQGYVGIGKHKFVFKIKDSASGNDIACKETKGDAPFLST